MVWRKFSLMALFSVLIAGIYLIPSQSQIAFAGMGIYEDKDFDGFSPFQGDCNDNDPTVYPGNGCDPVNYVIYVIELIEDKVETGELEINEGQTKSLLTKLNNAIDRFESDNTNAAVGSLNAFVHQVESFIKTEKISYENGQELIQVVQLLIDSL